MHSTAKARRSVRPRSTRDRISSLRAGAVTNFFAVPRGSTRFRVSIQPKHFRPGVHNIQFTQALGIRHAHTAEIAAPQGVRDLTETVLAAQILHRHASFRFAQEANDPLVGKLLLHVQSLGQVRLDSKSA